MAGKQGSNRLLAQARAHRYLGRLKGEDCWVNLAGSYDYLSLPYYVSQDLESAGERVRPTDREMLDAYVPPLLLEKAKLAGVPVPEYYISNGYFEAPAIVDPINPFTLKGRIVQSAVRAKSSAKSLTRNFTYAICCQELREGSRVTYFRTVLGWCSQAPCRTLATAVWDTFRIPVARVRVIVTADGRMLLSDIAPLPFETLTGRELKHIEERISWDK